MEKRKQTEQEKKERMWAKGCSFCKKCVPQ
jgi:hypothetical protein